MSAAKRVAHFIVHHPARAWLGLIGLVLAAAGFIAWKIQLNSDVLDMLPAHFESVQVYKLNDREFSSARDLFIGIAADSDETDMDAFTTAYTTALAKAPWVVRVMDRSPLEAPGGLEELRAVALPLMLNQGGPELDRLTAALQPEAITARLGKLRAKIESGVGLSSAELEYDPLGIVFPALKNVHLSRGKELNDPLFRLIIVHCRQETLDEPACVKVMNDMDEFNARFLAAWKAPTPAPKLYVTGRSAYVAEMAGKLKGDITSTINSSIALVALTFWAGFRKWKPLHAIMGTLIVVCVLSVAAGVALFSSLNMITVGLCALVVGLGVDFAMVLYALYAADETHTHEEAIANALHVHGSGIWSGAITTAISFLCLLFSGSPGYRQLGVLIACGILIAAIAMMSVFFLFLGVRLSPLAKKITATALGTAALVCGWLYFVPYVQTWTSSTWVNIGIGAALAVTSMLISATLCRHIPRLPAIAFAKPWHIAGPALTLFLILIAYAAAPVGGKIEFDLNPRSLEPKHSKAGDARHIISARTNPGGVESLLGVIEAPDRETLSAAWAKAEAAWQQHVGEGKPFIQLGSPAGLITSPARMKENAATLAKTVRCDESITAFDAALKANDLPPEQFATARAVLTALGEAAAGKLDVVEWEKNLPENSAWWFLIESTMSRTRPLGIGFIRPAREPATAEETAELRKLLTVPGVDIKFSGWSMTLKELGGWSQMKMAQLTALMIALNVALLIWLLRSWKMVTILMLGLTLSIGALFATLKATGISLNLFNILAFPLVLGVGVDYGIYIAIALRSRDATRELTSLMKPVLLSGLTTVIGFGSLAWAENPALRGLGMVCGIGIGWCLLATFVFVLPVAAHISDRTDPSDPS